MSSVDPASSSAKESKRFSACNNIADFYESLKIPARKTVGLFGGKSFTWYVTDNGQPFQVRCSCNMPSLGYGVLHVESRMASDMSNSRWFRKCSVVDPETSKVSMKSPLNLSKHEVRLPTPDKVN